METLDILMIGSEFTPIPAVNGGGTEKVVLEMASGLAQSGHKVRLLALKDEIDVKSEKLKKVDVIHVNSSSRSGAPKKIINFDFNIMKNVLHTDADVIHTHTRYGASTVGIVTRKPQVFSLHTKEAWQPSRGQIKPGLTFKIVRKVELFAIKNATLTLCVSEELKRIIDREISQTKNKTVAFHNAVNPQDYLLKKDESIMNEYGLDHSKFYVFNVGRLNPEKGTDVLLRAAAIVQKSNPEVEFIIVGPSSSFMESKQCETPYVERLKNLMVHLGIRNVRFLGQASFENVRKLYSISDVCVSPSYSEGMPLFVLEAMASAKPTIATNIGGSNEIITSNLDGVLFEPGDYRTLAELISTLASDKSRRADLGRKARVTIEQKFSWEKRIRDLVQIYKNIIL